MQQRVDERVLLVPAADARRSGGFVDDEQRFILEQNIERDFFRLRLAASPPANGPQSRRPRAGDAWPWWFAVDADVPSTMSRCSVPRETEGNFREEKYRAHAGLGLPMVNVPFAWPCGSVRRRFGEPSFFQLMRKSRDAGADAESATLNAGKSSGS